MRQVEKFTKLLEEECKDVGLKYLANPILRNPKDISPRNSFIIYYLMMKESDNPIW